MEITIPIHSIIDSITNSSTVTYIFARKDAVEIATGMIRRLMKTFGVQGEVEDYFDISVGPDPGWIEDAIEDYDNSDSKTTAEEYFENCFDSNGMCRRTIFIQSKKDSGFDMGAVILSMLDGDSYRDG